MSRFLSGGLRFQLTYRVLLAASAGVAIVLAAYRAASPDGQIHTLLEPESRRLAVRLLERHVVYPIEGWFYGSP